MDLAQIGMLLIAIGVAVLTTMWVARTKRHQRFITIRYRNGHVERFWFDGKL